MSALLLQAEPTASPHKNSPSHEVSMGLTHTAIKSKYHYYRKFIPDYASISAALSDLTKKSAPNTLHWTEPCQKAFDTLRERLCSSPVLRCPDLAAQFVLQTDASERGVGAVLSQQGPDGQEHPVGYFSRKYSAREQNYSTVEKECLAIKLATQAFQVYLLGREFVVETDHRALEWLHRFKDTNPRLCRWSLMLQPFKFTGEQQRGGSGLPGLAEGSGCDPPDSGSIAGQGEKRRALTGGGHKGRLWVIPDLSVGNGFPPLTKRLVERIQALEFVDMADLRPAQWQEVLDPEPDPRRYVILPGLEVARAKKKPVEDIRTWSMCFTIYTATVGIKHPEMTSDMLAHMLHILRSHREYEEPAWREYDVRFRQLAAVSGNKAWAQLDPQLYNQCFVGRARRVASSPQPGEASAGITKPARAEREGKAKSEVCFRFNREGSCPYNSQCRCHVELGTHRIRDPRPQISGELGIPGPKATEIWGSPVPKSPENWGPLRRIRDPI
eukprot:Em0023g856a